MTANVKDVRAFQESLLDTKQAADVLGYSSVTLAQWRWQNRGPRYFKIGRRVRYRPCDLEAWLCAQFTGTKDQPVDRAGEIQ